MPTYLHQCRISSLKIFFILAISFVGFTRSFAQVGISTTTITPAPSSILELRSTTAGFLPPRMTTTERDAITSPAEGLVIYNTTTGLLNFRNGSSWQMFGSGSVSSISVASTNGFSGTVATASTTPVITISTSISGVLKGNGTAISAATSGTDYSAGTSALATGILKSTTSTGALSIAVAGDFPTFNQNTTGTASNITGILNAASHPALTGDVTTPSGSAVTTITNNAVTLAKFQQIATNSLLGRSTAATGNTEVITVGSGLTLSGGTLSATNTNAGTVTSVSVASANGLAGTVATPATTPVITLSTNVTGVLKGNGTAISAATSGTDYSAGTSALATGILKSTTTTGTLTTAVAADFPTLNQNSTGTASNITGILNASSFPALTGDITTPSGSVATTIGTGKVTNTMIANSTIDLTTKVTGILPVANGGTNSSTQNWVDLTTIQNSIAGAKTWTAIGTFNAGITTTGAAVNLNTSSNFASNINTGTSTGTVTIGGSANQAISIGSNAAGVKTIDIGNAAAGAGSVSIKNGTTGTITLGTLGTGFNAIIKGSQGCTATPIPKATNTEVTYALTNVTANATVIVSFSAALPAGIFVAYTRTISGNVIVAYNNSTNGTLNLVNTTNIIMTVNQ